MKKKNNFRFVLVVVVLVAVNFYADFTINQDEENNLNLFAKKVYAQTEEPYGNDQDGECRECTFTWNGMPTDGVEIVCTYSPNHYCEAVGCTFGFC